MEQPINQSDITLQRSGCDKRKKHENFLNGQPLFDVPGEPKKYMRLINKPQHRPNYINLKHSTWIGQIIP